MPEITPDRVAAGKQSAVAILEAMVSGDWQTGVPALYNGDPVPTMLALAAAWQVLAEVHAENIPGLLASMRAEIAEVPNV